MVVIEPWTIVLSVLAVVALAIVVWLARRFFRDYYVRKHDREIRRERRNRFRRIKRNKGHSRRKRDRMFR